MKSRKLMLAEALIVLVLITLACTGIILYYNSRIASLESNILSVQEQAQKNIDSMEQNVLSGIESLNASLSNNLGLLERKFSEFQRKNEIEIMAISSLIDEIETQSDIQLNQLKNELKSVKVQGNDFSAITDEVIRSVVRITSGNSQGSGVIIGNGSLIVTNMHVIGSASSIKISTYEKDTYSADLLAYDSNLDLSLLKIDSMLEPLEFGDSDSLKQGERVIAIGNPAGLSFTVTEGIVSSLHRTGPNGLPIYIQTDVPINPGNSGGPLINIHGEIVGLNNFKVAGLESLGFAIESNSVEEFVDKAMSE
ncbi:trypsin-like peptidase domain-containing protein [Candidatus Woesearchaeota archaeon]|nr:trypsin-like peptidase domain-containing protein [Candidatus Woesearchaeota archaeon]